MKTFKYCLFLVFNFFTLFVWAQIPSTDIYLLDVSIKDTNYIFSNPTKIATGNGYNNQPYFMPDGKSLLFTSIGSDNQADIYKYDLKIKSVLQLTSTKQFKEYSPQLTPDKKMMSVVRVEEDDSTQHLWLYDLNGKPIKMLSAINPVGYYSWLNENNIALAVLQKGDRMDAEFLDLESGISRTIAKNIGRCMVTNKVDDTTQMCYYVQKKQNDSIFLVNAVATKKIKHFNEIQPTSFMTLPNSEDYCLFYNGFLIGNNGKLYLNKNRKYKAIANFKNTPYQNFYRIAYYPISKTKGKLALVVYANKKP